MTDDPEESSVVTDIATGLFGTCSVMKILWPSMGAVAIETFQHHNHACGVFFLVESPGASRKSF